MNKICLVTHESDADGAFPIILSRLVFEAMDVFSCEIKEVDSVLENVFSHEKDYDKIYIVDLCMSEELAQKVNVDNGLKGKVFVFDHHASCLPMNHYSFIKIVDEENGIRECGTTLFWKYLTSVSDKKILFKPCLKKMIEWVRQMDTYCFSDDEKENAFSFGSLYVIYGRERYIEHFYDYVLHNEEFIFSDTDKLLIALEEEKAKQYIQEKMEHVKFARVDGVRVGIAFAEQRRSSLGHEMASKLDIDVAVVINVDRSVSYRAEKEEVDVTVLASSYGGGGHKHAAGNPLPEDLQEKIVNLLFKDVVWEK